MGTVLAGPQKDLDDTMILALLLLSSLFILPTSQEHDEAGRETSKHKGGNRDKGRSASESVQALQISTAAGQEEVLKVPPTENKKLVKTAMCGRPPGNRQIDRFSEAIGNTYEVFPSYETTGFFNKAFSEGLPPEPIGGKRLPRSRFAPGERLARMVVKEI